AEVAENLREVVVGAVLATGHDDAGDGCQAARPAQRADVGRFIGVAARRSGAERVGAGQETGEAIRAATVRRGGQVYGLTEVIRPGQHHGHTAEDRVAGRRLAAVGVVVDDAGQRARLLHRRAAVVGAEEAVLGAVQDIAAG